MAAIVRWVWVRGWRLWLGLLFLPVLWLLGREGGPTAPDGSPANIEPAWAEGATSEGGFLAVEGILRDPRTTRDPPRPAETLLPREEPEPESGATTKAPKEYPNRKPLEVSPKWEPLKESTKTKTIKKTSQRPTPVSHKLPPSVPHRERAKKLFKVPKSNGHKGPRVKGDLIAAAKDNNNSDFISVMSYNSHFAPHRERAKKVPKSNGHKGPRVKGDLIAAAKDNNNSDFISVMSYNSHFAPHTTRDLYSPGYLLENLKACTKDRAEVLVAVLVISAPEHFAQRAAIRATWGVATGQVVFSFVVGAAEGGLRGEVEAEARREGDLVISRVADHYENLGLKTISALDWVVQMCPEAEYVLKVDDDMFVQVERLLELVSSLVAEDRSQKLIIGNISKGWGPVRNPKSKYYITEAQYGGEKYPDFATGPSYLVSRAAVLPMVEEALDQLYIHLEDVFLTGVVAERLGVERRNNEQFKNNAVRVPARFMGCTLLHTITIHKVDPEEQEELHQLASSPTCGRGGSRPGALSRTDWKKALHKMGRGEQQYLKAMAEKNKV